MLNETFELSESMKAAGIVTESWHKDYGTCPKNKTFRMFISEGGSGADMEHIADIGEIGFLRKWEVSNGTSFPAFNVMPLLLATTQEDRDNVNTLKKSLKSQNVVDENQARTLVDALSNTCKPFWGKSEIERIDRCLKFLPKSLAQILGTVPQDFGAVEELIRRSGLVDADALQEFIKKNVIRRIVQSPIDANFWIDSLLVSSTVSAKKVSLVLEVADWSSFKYPVNHKKVQEWINSRLMEANMPALAHKAMSQEDAFGRPLAEADSDEKFPEAELKMILGKVTLRAMSSESPCQARYGKTDAKSFPCGRETRQLMKNSLEWLGKADRKGKTWQNVSDACGYDRGVLFSYPSELPEDPPELASLFVSEESVDRDGSRFEAAAARVVPALGGIVKKHPNTEVRVFVLAKPDGYRTKVLVSRNYDASSMISAAQDWQDGCNNLPSVSLNIGKRDSPTWIAPLTPFPAEVVRCLNIAWLGSGVRTKPVHGLGIGDGIGLLMERGSASRAIVERALHLAVTNTRPLLLALGHADHKRDGAFNWNKDTAKYRKHAALLPSLLGLLLHKLNYTRGGYMDTSPFQVGRMLALADTLHKEYCHHVRKEETPHQLFGNALMSTALGNPTAGLARLSERIAPYQAWANTATGEGVGLAKWALRQFGQLAHELSKQTLPETCNDADKAQMLLGYLARPEKDASNS